MPPTSSSASDKSRQTSGGKSFFGRKLHKDKDKDKDKSSSSSSAPDDRHHHHHHHHHNSNNHHHHHNDGYHGWGSDSLAPPGSSAGSRSSRYSKHSSVQSVDMGYDTDASGFPISPSVVTSIPFESLPADKTPIPVDTVTKPDLSKKEPSPNHVAKAFGDFHQYPTFVPPPPVPSSHANHPTGPRPPPHGHNYTMAGSASGDKNARYQHWGRPGSSSANGAFGHNSSSTLDSSSNSRTSLDQASIYSSVSSNTRGSTYFPSDGSSRTLTTSTSTDRNHPHAGSGRFVNAHAPWLSSQPPPPIPVSPEKYLARPKDDRVVDQLFLDLMHKRGWQHLPEQAKRQMVSYPASKKWTLVHQDRLTELQGEQRRRQNARQTHGHDAPSGLLERADEEGSPEWYVKKVLDDTLTSKQLASLSVSLRTQPIR